MMGDNGYYGGSVAARYDESSSDMFAPAVVDPVLDVLAEMAGPVPLRVAG